jgi:hypothetical protein
MSARQLRARLNRLPQPPTEVIGEDRNRDRKRREELRGRKLSPAGLTEREKAEYTKLEALFHDDDRLLSREFELTMKQFNAEVRGGGKPRSYRDTKDIAIECVSWCYIRCNSDHGHAIGASRVTHTAHIHATRAARSDQAPLPS